MRTSLTSCIAALALLLAVAPARAQFRAPQVPVQGTALQQFLAARGQAIVVSADQRDAPIFSGIWLTRPPTFFVASTEAGDAALSLYNAGQPAPTFGVLPSTPAPGWHAAVTFGAFPDRAIVQSFDAADVLQGTVTYPGVSVFAVGLAVSDGSGTYYSEDALDTGGAPRLLYFLGTGEHAGDVWLAAETDGDGDFADAVYLLAFFAPVPVERATWGALKRRFR